MAYSSRNKFPHALLLFSFLDFIQKITKAAIKPIVEIYCASDSGPPIVILDVSPLKNSVVKRLMEYKKIYARKTWPLNFFLVDINRSNPKIMKFAIEL